MLKRNALLSVCLVVACNGAIADCSTDGLEVTGQIKGGTTHLDMDALHDLPRTRIVTTTAVSDGAHSFTGFLIRDLLDRVGATGDDVLAVALNDYVVDIPMSDFRDFDVIAAYSMDGTTLTRKDKGPLWIVYPRDDHAQLQDIRYDYRWVWQLCEIEVK